MKSRAIIPLVIGLAIGIFAIKYFINVVKKAKGNSTELVEVVCANSDIAPTVEIKESMLEVKTLPKILAPKMCFNDRKEVIGRVASLAISTGMPVVSSLLAPKGTPPGLTVLIKDGYRAVAVQVDEFAGVAGWIKPGSRVDVVAVMTGRTGMDNETISKVILQNIEVLAVGQETGSKADVAASVAKSVTLSVQPSEVPKLHLAATKGKIRLAMRSQVDAKDDERIAQTTDNDLLGLPPVSAGKKPQSNGSSILAGLFGKQAKEDGKATDKEAMSPRLNKAMQQPVAAAPQPPADAVQIYSGPSFKEELQFRRDGKLWRNVGRTTKLGDGRELAPVGPQTDAGLTTGGLSPQALSRIAGIRAGQ